MNNQLLWGAEHPWVRNHAFKVRFVCFYGLKYLHWYVHTAHGDLKIQEVLQ